MSIYRLNTTGFVSHLTASRSGFISRLLLLVLLAFTLRLHAAPKRTFRMSDKAKVEWKVQLRSKEFAEIRAKFNESGDHAAAAEEYERFFAESQKSLGTEHDLLVAIRKELAHHYKWLGELDKCEPLYDTNLEVSRKLHGERDRAVANALIDVAGLKASFGEYPQAEALYRKALAIYDKLAGNVVGSVAVLMGMSNCVSSLGEHEQAEGFLRRALRGIEKLKDGKGSQASAMIMDNLSYEYVLLGRLKEAEQFSKSQLDIWEAEMAKATRPSAHQALSQAILSEMFGAAASRPGPNALRPSLATGLFQHALVKDAQGEDAEAERLYQSALKLAEKHFGKEHRMP
ncbi:MAG TPA: tetratricopeptide repeat protein, partial [Pirellulales bacterium]